MVYYIYIVRNVDNTIHNIIIGIIYILMLSYFYNNGSFLSFRIKTQRRYQQHIAVVRFSHDKSKYYVAVLGKIRVKYLK